MRVLHVHDIANIPKLLARELSLRGIETEFVEEIGSVNIGDYDIIHGHYALNRHTIDAFRLARRKNIPFVLHCHGSDLRLLTGTRRVNLPFHYRIVSQHLRKHSTAIILSTPDLIEFEPRGTYLPNPVDMNRFRPIPEIKKTDRILICGKQIKGSGILEYIDKEKEYDCVNSGQELDWPKNVKRLELVLYKNFPQFLNGYREMLGTFGDVISMARLEAMSCGLKTFTNFDESFARFYEGQNPDRVENPREFISRFHSPSISVERIIEIYRGIISA